MQCTIKLVFLGLFLSLFSCGGSPNRPIELKNSKTATQKSPSKYTATYGYHSAGSSAGYFEIYLHKSGQPFSKSNLVLRVKGTIKNADWKGNDTLLVQSEGYLREFNNLDGFPVVVQLNHIERRL
ncbi:MAG TPA: hypothetical protein VFD91_02700 [Mariniphaga sp.]|nr:hypothetical protein [Mariniphaga sp.]